MKRVLIALLMVVLAGCGGSSTSDSDSSADAAGDGPVGAALFEQAVIGASAGCVTCHSFDEGVVLVGPSLFDLAGRAASQVDGLTAEEYVRQSIVEPDAFVVPDFAAGLMVNDFEDIITEAQIDSLVTYLLGK